MTVDVFERVQPLAGLVGPAAETLFLRLLARGFGTIGTDPGDLAPGDPALCELLDLGLAFPCGEDDAVVRPVDRAVALRMLIEQRQSEAVAAQRRILDGWSRLTSLLPRDVGGGVPGDVDGVLPLANVEDVLTRTAELYRSARRRMRITDPDERRGRSARAAARTNSVDAVRFQVIGRIGGGNATTERSAAAGGEEIRLRPDVPARLVHVDDSVALLAADRGATTALLVRSPAILGLLANWFDLLWTDPSTIVPGGVDSVGLSEPQRRVLELMAVDGDEAIARRLRMSVTTVRRHVRAIYAVLGVGNRFAAGVAAAKRGWL